MAAGDTMKMTIFFFFLGGAEFIYSHNLTVDGREILLHIWDVPSSQVREVYSYHPFLSQGQKKPLYWKLPMGNHRLGGPVEQGSQIRGFITD